jgi:O-antigen biosynthesis protein
MGSVVPNLEVRLRPRPVEHQPLLQSRSRTRPAVDGKFLRIGEERFWVKGVTYGTFAPDGEGQQFPPLARIAEDFAAMRRASVNTVRTYTVPSSAVLDLAAEHGLRVMVGLPWTQHVAFLDDSGTCAGIRRQVASDVRSLASHPAVLLVALGNEIPASVIRWLGPARVERFLRELYAEGKAIAPETLFTYVNYPPTEYLDLSFVDVCAFNIYLHRDTDLRAYLARLQNIAGLRPLLLAEAGADSRRNGRDGQAALLGMQLRAAFAEGACGTVAFAWTDEWWRGGGTVDDWAFGLVDTARHPKPALQVVTEAYEREPFPPPVRASWPRVSVVVCAYNAAATIAECLESLTRLDGPEAELIVVNDGSRDGTGEIARRFPGVHVIDIPNGGLSLARNVGLAAASGEIVAYTDADVRVDPHWLAYLVEPLVTTDAVAAGGPNVVPPDDPWMAQAVARSPGGPTHVLLDDRVAEHVPGCNIAVRRAALQAIGGFNPIFLRAGDDVDVCWRLQGRGWKIAYAPAALVWHRHRASVRAYWRQQVGYGEGQVWLAPHHPDKFRGRRIGWCGHIYSPLPYVRSLTRPRVNTGVWGTAAFPSVYHAHAHPLATLPHSVRWQLASALLLLSGLLIGPGSGGVWAGLAIAVGTGGLLATVGRCVRHALASDIETLAPIGGYSMTASRAIYRATIAWLHLVQPIARAVGQMRGLLSPPLPSSRGPRLAWAPAPSASDTIHGLLLLVRRRGEWRFWSEQWASSETLLTGIAARLRSSPLVSSVEAGDGWHDDRDIRTEAGPFAWLDLRVLVEEHSGGRCLVRFGQRVRIRLLFIMVTLAVLVGVAGGWPLLEAERTSVTASVLGLILVGAPWWHVARALASTRALVRRLAAEQGWQPLDAVGEPAPTGRPLTPRWTTHRFRMLTRILPIVGLGLASPVLGVSQSLHEITGTVTDATGGVLVGAQVEVKGEGTRCSVETDERGRYRCSRLPPGGYELHVALAGFQPVTEMPTLGRRESVTLNVVMDVVVSAEIDVSPAGDSAAWARPLTERVLMGPDLDELPSEPGQLLRRLRELAGVTGRPGDLAVYVDGFRQALRLQPREAIQMIKVSSDPFAAQFAEPGRIRIDIITKPGTERYHGELALNFNDNALNGLNAFSPARTPAQTRHYTGYFSGPIIPRWWSVVLYGGRWEHDTTEVVRATALDPGTLAPVSIAQEVLAPRTIDNAWLGMDFSLDLKHTLAVTGSTTQDTATNQGLDEGLDLPERAWVETSREDFGRLALTSVLTPQLLNELRVELNQRRSSTEAVTDAPAVIVLDAFRGGGNQNALFSQRRTQSLRLSNTVTMARGRSTFKFGVAWDVARQRDDDRSGFGGSYLFGADVERDAQGAPIPGSALVDPLERYRRTLLGLPGYRPSQFTIVQGDPRVEFWQWWSGTFAQGDWAPSRRFSLSYGVRHEVQSHTPIAGNLAPRLGLAWTPGDTGANTIRAGAGVFYDRIPARVPFDARRLDGRRQQRLIVPEPSFFRHVPDELPDGVPRQSAVHVLAPDLETPRSLLAGLSYDRRLSERVVASVGYTRGRGERLLRRRNINAPVDGVLPDPDRGAILQYESTARSERHEWSAALRTSWTQNVIVYGTYTWVDAVSETDGPTTTPADSHTPSNELGAARRDARHYLTLGTTLRLPHRLMVTASSVFRSGRPFNITTGRDDNHDTLFTDRPAFADPSDPGAIVTPYGAFNPRPGPDDPIIPRNFGQEPADVRVNLHVSRSFRPGPGRTSVTLRGDATNVLNRANLTAFNGVLTSPAFGTANRALDPRRIELSLRVTF